jgi:hypothetical protein
MTDAYDLAIAHLTAHPEEIFPSWSSPYHLRYPAGILFREVGPWDTPFCGCLTQIRRGSIFFAFRDKDHIDVELTRRN